MRSGDSISVDTVNAAAAAIVASEARPQPPAAVQKRRWGNCWSLNWCFGGYPKTSKRIGNAVLVPEPVNTSAAAPVAENLRPSAAILLPFIAPPSSPTSFLQSDPPSISQSPAGLVSLASLAVSANSPDGPTSVFSVGPYAYETQLVSPPVFSTFTTEPSTASFTPPPESVQATTPSSPEVPFAELLTSSLERARRNNGSNKKFALSQCEFQPYQVYPGSPGGKLISPGSTVSNSGTSSPFPGKHPVFGFHLGDTSKLLGFEHFTVRKWGSRLGSGSLTPDGAALGSRLGSGALTPDGVGLDSRLGSGCLTPDGVGPPSRDGDLLNDGQISIDNGSIHDEPIVDHRISFELTSEDVARCLENKSAASIHLESSQEIVAGSTMEGDAFPVDPENSCDLCIMEGAHGRSEKFAGESNKGRCQKHCLNAFGSVKEFNFDNTDNSLHMNPVISSEWWVNDKVTGNGAKPESKWSFLPLLQPEVS